MLITEMTIVNHSVRLRFPAIQKGTEPWQLRVPKQVESSRFSVPHHCTHFSKLDNDQGWRRFSISARKVDPGNHGLT
jgi:hypothetical protein